MHAAARRFVTIGALLLALATGLGAWAAHGLEALIGAAALATFRTGVEYHFYHSLGLLGVGLLIDRLGTRAPLLVSGWLLVAGIVMFSGSLYALAFSSARFLGPVTPLGGLCFIGAWACLALALWPGRRS
jgi:uncharacterized membrane protein YgdD (TMEM256/DUF423 family)